MQATTGGLMEMKIIGLITSLFLVWCIVGYRHETQLATNTARAKRIAAYHQAALQNAQAICRGDAVLVTDAETGEVHSFSCKPPSPPMITAYPSVVRPGEIIYFQVDSNGSCESVSMDELGTDKAIGPGGQRLSWSIASHSPGVNQFSFHCNGPTGERSESTVYTVAVLDSTEKPAIPVRENSRGLKMEGFRSLQKGFRKYVRFTVNQFKKCYLEAKRVGFSRDEAFEHCGKLLPPGTVPSSTSKVTNVNNPTWSPGEAQSYGSP